MKPRLVLAFVSVVSPFAQAQGSGVLLGMRIEKVARAEAGIAVVTTGAEFLLGDDGVIRCTQRLPARREVARIKLPSGALPLTLGEQDDFACAVSGQRITLTVQGDSLIIFRADAAIHVSFRGLFRPAYHASKEGKWLFIDPKGGFGIYPVRKRETKPPVLNESIWGVDYEMKKGDEIWFSVFPPRPYNWPRAFEPIAHEGAPKQPYPSTKLIRSAARFCKVLVVHSYIWPGGDRPPWLIPTFVPSDRRQFDRMRDDVHRSGMKLLVYFSPFYYKSLRHVPGDDFLAEMRRALNDYKVDGFYFDGISMDFRQSYRIIRQARQLLGGDRLLYVHCSSDPLGSTRIYCPFIDTYADFILRGEAGRGGLKLDDFLRWILSGHNISNAVGYWCYYGSTGKKGYVKDDPTAEHIAAALRNEVRIPRTEIGFEVIWEPGSGHLDFFDREYYRRLARRQHKARAR